MTHHLEIGIVSRICEGKANRVIDPPYRAYCVLDTHKKRFALVAESPLEVGGNREINSLLLHHANGIRNQALVSFRQQAHRIVMPRKKHDATVLTS